jgi:hypothetical protein
MAMRPGRIATPVAFRFALELKEAEHAAYAAVVAGAVAGEGGAPGSQT